MYRKPLEKEISISELTYLRNQGLTNKQIAEKLGYSKNTISRYLPRTRKENVKLSESDKAEIVSLYTKGTSVLQIAAKFNASTTAIYHVLGVIVKKKSRKQKTAVSASIDIQVPEEKPSGRLKRKDLIIYTGLYGSYTVDAKEGTVLLKETEATLNKEELRLYIRDLMDIWKELG